MEKFFHSFIIFHVAQHNRHLFRFTQVLTLIYHQSKHFSILYFTTYLIPYHICHNVQYFVLYVMMCVLRISWIVRYFLCNCFVKFAYHL